MSNVDRNLTSTFDIPCSLFDILPAVSGLYFYCPTFTFPVAKQHKYRNMKKQRTDNFDKFSNKTRGSAVKEAFRQEKEDQIGRPCSR